MSGDAFPLWPRTSRSRSGNARRFGAPCRTMAVPLPEALRSSHSSPTSLSFRSTPTISVSSRLTKHVVPRVRPLSPARPLELIVNRTLCLLITFIPFLTSPITLFFNSSYYIVLDSRVEKSLTAIRRSHKRTGSDAHSNFTITTSALSHPHSMKTLSRRPNFYSESELPNIPDMTSSSPSRLSELSAGSYRRIPGKNGFYESMIETESTADTASLDSRYSKAQTLMGAPPHTNPPYTRSALFC